MKQRAVGKEISRLAHTLYRTLYNCHADSFSEGISGANIRIIRFLADHKDRDIFQKDIEEEFSVRRSTVSKVLALMEDKGLIERKAVQSDARLKRLVLTARGEEIVRITTDAAIATESRLIEGFSEEELLTLRSFLNRMMQNLGECDANKETDSKEDLV